MKSEQGFTLIEMIIAIGIFAMIAAMSYGALNQVIDVRERMVDRNDLLKSLQTTFSVLDRDMRFALPRSVRNGFGENEAAMISTTDAPFEEGELVRLTTSAPDPRLGKLQRLSRVALRLEDGKLYRDSWQVLDRDQDSKKRARLLLENVGNVALKFISWTEEGSMATSGEWSELNKLPAGVEIVVTVNDIEYRRIYEVANGL